MNTFILNSNAVLRLLLGDDEAASAEIGALLERAEHGDVRVVLDPLVVAECCALLHGPVYGIDKGRIADTLIQLVMLNGLESDDAIRITEALHRYAAQDLDFTDAYLSVVARQMKGSVTHVD